jgi:hypothetical protein
VRENRGQPRRGAGAQGGAQCMVSGRTTPPAPAPLGSYPLLLRSPLSSPSPSPFRSSFLLQILQCLHRSPRRRLCLGEKESDKTRGAFCGSKSRISDLVPGQWPGHGCFPQLPPGRTWGRSRRRSAPALSWVQGRSTGSARRK